MKQKNIEFFVGLLAMLSVLAVVFLCVKVAGEEYYFSNHHQKGYQIFAHFNNIGNLKVGAPVRTSGVLVGRVNSIALDQQNYQAKVGLLINSQYTFSQDTSASILTMGILGEQYIGLQQGGDSLELKSGDTIYITNSAFVIEELLNKLIVNFLGKSKN